MKQINAMGSSTYRVIHKKMGKKSRSRSFRKRYGETKPLPKATFKSWVVTLSFIGLFTYVMYLITHAIFN